jgi:Mn-containing catalase
LHVFSKTLAGNVLYNLKKYEFRQRTAEKGTLLTFLLARKTTHTKGSKKGLVELENQNIRQNLDNYNLQADKIANHVNNLNKNVPTNLFKKDLRNSFKKESEQTPQKNIDNVIDFSNML